MTIQPKLFAALLCGVLLGCTACASAANSSSGASSAPASSTAPSSAPSASSEPSSPGGAAAFSGDTVVILLDYNAGTGFEWTFQADPEDAVTLIDQATESAETSSEPLAGGALHERFTFRALKAGEVTLTFNLIRPWEDNSAETQVYAFTVDDDLNLTLNPYKSSFDHEPEWSASA